MYIWLYCIYLGLPHTSDLPTLMTHNYRLEKVIDLTFGK